MGSFSCGEGVTIFEGQQEEPLAREEEEVVSLVYAAFFCLHVA